MRKSSRSISLALIGSALLLGGCQPAAEENGNEWTDEKDVAQADNGNPNANDNEWSEGEAPAGENATLDGVATGNAQYNHGGGMGRTASGIGGAMIGSQIGRSLGRGMAGNPGYGGGYGNGNGNGGMTASPSSRGGFGSSAGGFGASGRAGASS